MFNLAKRLVRLRRPYGSSLVILQPPNHNLCKFNQIQSVRHLQTTPRRHIHPLIVALFKPAARIAAPLSGRLLRRLWLKLPPEKKAKYLEFLKSKAVILTGGFGVFFLSLYASHIKICPLTGRKRFLALKTDQVERIASMEAEALEEEYKATTVNPSHPVYRTIERVASRILKANQDLEPMKDRKVWSVTVVDQPVRNAFVLPSGQIFVFTGMLQVVNEEQLAIILAHEIAHALLDHTAEKLSYVNALHAVILIPMALLWAVIPSDGIAMVTDWFFHQIVDIVFELPFSREMETEADEVGLSLAARACFDVREAPALWTKLAIIDGEEQEQSPEFLSTHPANETRAENLKRLLPGALNTRVECKCADLRPPNPELRLKEFIREFEKKYKKAITVVV